MAFENDPEGRQIAMGYAGRDFDQPKIVSIETLCEYGSNEWSPTQFLEMIQKAIAAIPADKLDSSLVELKGGYEESTKLRIRYSGSESAETVADRVRRCELYVAEWRASEKAAYERLKAKLPQETKP